MRFYSAFLFLLVSLSVSAQRNFNDAAGFSQHLIKLQQHKDALIVLDQVKLSELSAVQKDSLNFLLGYTYYLDKDLDSAGLYLDKVSLSSSLYSQSSYYSLISMLNKGKSHYDAAGRKLLSMKQEEEYRQLWLTEYGGLLLLERDYDRFDSISKLFDHSYYAVTKEQAELERYHKAMIRMKKKSPFVAGTLSAVIPGMGKLYAGYRGKALSSFISVTSLAAVATECYFRDGVKSPSFIFFAGLFSVFYTGNIWGSVLSVRIKQDETFREFDRNILLDLHIPLRRIYN